MNLTDYQTLLEYCDDLIPGSLAAEMELHNMAAMYEAIATLAYLDDCRHRHLEPRLDLLRHFVNVDFSGSQ